MVLNKYIMWDSICSRKQLRTIRATQDQHWFQDEGHEACCAWRERKQPRNNAILDSLIQDEQAQLRIQAGRPDASQASPAAESQA